MIIKVKWHFKEATDCIGKDFIVKGFTIQNGKGIGEIEVQDDLSDDILGEVLASSFSIMSMEESNRKNKAPEVYEVSEVSEVSEEDLGNEEVADDENDEGFMVLTGNSNQTNKKYVPKVKSVKDEDQEENNEVEVQPQPSSLKNTTSKSIKSTRSFQDDYVKTIDELYEQFDIAAKTKNSQISTENILNTREKMIAEEQKAKEEAIDIPAWIVNKKYASLTVNDIGIGLNLNMPVDLSRYSAKKLRVSRDLKSLLAKKFIELISPKEATQIFNDNNSTTINFNELGQTKDKKQAFQEIRSGRFDQRFSDDGNYTPDENVYDPNEDSSIDLTNDVQRHSHNFNGPNKINGKPVQKNSTNQKSNMASNGKPKFRPIRPMSEM